MTQSTCRSSTQKAQAESLDGVVQKIRFSSPDTGWSIMVIKSTDGTLATVVGTAPGVTPGEKVSCRGEWITVPRWGQQFKANDITMSPPSSASDLEKYLASGVIQGIGKTYAKKLITVFGDKLADILDNSPYIIEGINGIGPERRKKIAHAWKKHQHVRDIMVFLSKNGLGSARALRIYRRYGEKAVSVLRDNPYRLAEDFRGIGFETADKTAKHLGIKNNATKRIRAGLRYVLMNQRLRGHCAFEKQNLAKETQKLLNINTDEIKSTLDIVLEKGFFVQETFNGQTLIYLKSLYEAEKSVTRNIHRLVHGVAAWGKIDHNKAIARAEKLIGFTFSPSQRSALFKIIDHKISIMTGGPGTGKTSLVQAVLNIIESRVGNIELCAPTGKAARRLSETTGRDAKTIHRLLGVVPGKRSYVHNTNNLLDVDVVIIDELSMVDLELIASLLDAIPSHASILFVGDKDQLESVGPGQVLSDLMASGIIVTVHLKENRRQSENSLIILNAHRINHGLLPHIEDGINGDFLWFKGTGSEDISKQLNHVIFNYLPQHHNVDPLKEVQVLTPMKKGCLGTLALNKVLQSQLNPNPTKIVQFGQNHLGTGDRVIQVANNYDKAVFNGDSGHVKDIDTADKRLLVSFESQDVEYEFDELDDLIPSFAITIHRSQGSEYPVVVLPVTNEHYILLTRRLLYTGITRGKKLVVLVGEDRAVRTAINNNRSHKRITTLEQRLTSCAA